MAESASLVCYDRPKAVLFGDSITQYCFDLDIHGWGSSLAQFWCRKIDVINRGFSGYNTAFAKRIVDKAFTGDNVIFGTIFFGANDATLESSAQHVPLDQFESNLHTIVDCIRSLRGLDFPLLLISPPPIFEMDWEVVCLSRGKSGLDRSNDRACLYASVVSRVGLACNIPVIDIWHGLEGDSENRRRYLSDGLHLSRDGNEKLAELVKNSIKQHYPRLCPEVMAMHYPDWKDANEANLIA